MKMGGKIELLKKSFLYLLENTRREDRIAIVTYSGNAKIVLESTPCNQKYAIGLAIEKLESKGETQAFKGAKLAYEVAANHFIANGNNRVIFATDGSFPIEEQFSKLVNFNAQEKIQMSVFYFDAEESKGIAGRLSNLAKIGNGNYAHITGQNANDVFLNEAKGIRQE
jgi:Ca-activated chloride channel homolog